MYTLISITCFKYSMFTKINYTHPIYILRRIVKKRSRTILLSLLILRQSFMTMLSCYQRDMHKVSAIMRDHCAKTRSIILVAKKNINK